MPKKSRLPCPPGIAPDAMADTATPNQVARRSRSIGAMFNRLIARPSFQAWAARLPFVSRAVRSDGEALFDIVAGFVNAQVLAALVELGICESLLDGPQEAVVLARGTGVPMHRMDQLLRAGVALNLLKLRRDGRFALGRRGAALVGVPGLRAMIRHHGAFYNDMSDPLALLRGESETELAQVWPYVFGNGGAADPEIKRFYSDLMADSQALVATDTLRMVDFSGIECLMDVGGGSGTFALALAQAYPELHLGVFDLPGVADQARARFETAGCVDRLEIHQGSFRDDLLPRGADAISLIRVLYDHTDETVSALLRACFEVLPPGGKLIISEPMTGGAKPSRAGDVYFAFYCMAMQTGRARSAERIAGMVSEAGFDSVRIPKAPRPFVTSCVTACRPD